MSIVNTFEAVPSRLLSIYAAVAEVENGVLTEHLASWATPPSLSRRGGENEDGGSTNLLKASLAEARRLGLVDEKDGRLFVPDAARGRGGRNANLEAHVLSYLRETFFDPERAASAGQAGFLIALAWFLTKNPLQPVSFSDAPQNQLRSDLGQFAGKAELGSTASFQNLLYWARFLGFATVVGDAESKRAFPDPIRAISAVLDRVFPDNKWVDMDMFLSRLAAIYPVLEGGSVREEVEASSTVPPAVDGRLSVASSLALQRLADRGLILLDVVADARARILDFGGNTKRVSRVRRGTAA